MNRLPTLKLNPIRRGAVFGKHHSEQGGFTIIESLAAIIVVTIMLVGITPMLAIAVATRVQARRVELGAQAARTYIDHLRTGQLDHPTVSNTPLANAAAPSGSLSCDGKNGNYCQSPSTLYCVDGDGDKNCRADSMTDMLVQGVGYNAFSNDATRGYTLLVRVYRADAFKDSTPLTTASVQATFTGGEGNRKAPLVTSTTEITGAQYRDFRCRLNEARASDDFCR
ncbi:hormogonium polysaccharide secretion pseudopilin HpsB [[Phormidium] sp. ETS-05]|uniref:hormogonium polysaccharide secretion pseudopilin HpsB n=1 Tax=[Phormidium] sp. ETS-05 TaxID=222819 RepID=UPI0018EF09E9|nr:hormogonium polysaccharide secretion pseudopilin HpsB [[Phormidium] sp. ETS-05]